MATLTQEFASQYWDSNTPDTTQAPPGDLPHHCWGASLRISGQDLAVHHYSGAKRHFCLMAHILFIPRLCGGSSPLQPLQLHTSGFQRKQITLVLGLTCLYSYSKPCFPICNSFSSIFKQISHCWKKCQRFSLICVILTDATREGDDRYLPLPIIFLAGVKTYQENSLGFTMQMWNLVHANEHKSNSLRSTDNFAYKRPKLMWLKAYLFFPVPLDGLRECGFANEPCHGCDLHQRAGPEA